MKKLLSLCVLFTHVLFAQIPTNGLIGRWEFSGNASDGSASNNHGTVHGATLVSDRCGNPNSAYSFNGSSSYIEMLNAGPTGTVSRSLSFWALTSYTAFGSEFQATSLFSYGGLANNPFGTYYQINYNYNCQGVGMDVGNVEIIRGNNCISDNRWHHVAVVYDAVLSTDISNIKFYVDGVLLPSQITCYMTGTSQALVTGNLYPITIGGSSSGARCFPGILDDIYLYNRALSVTEVQQLFNQCAQPVMGNPNVCGGTVTTYSVPPSTGNSIYTWHLPPGWTGSSTTNTISVTTGNAGTISVSYNTSCGGSLTQQLVIANSVVPAISLSQPTVCPGQPVTLSVAGNYSYTWMPGSLNGSSITITPTATTVYTVNASGPMAAPVPQPWPCG